MKTEFYNCRVVLYHGYNLLYRVEPRKDTLSGVFSWLRRLAREPDLLRSKSGSNTVIIFDLIVSSG